MANTREQFNKLVAAVTKTSLKQAEHEGVDVYEAGGRIMSDDMLDIIVDTSKRAYRMSPFYKTVISNMLAISCGSAEHQDDAVQHARKQSSGRSALKFFQTVGLSVVDYAVLDLIHEQVPVDTESDEDDD